MSSAETVAQKLAMFVSQLKYEQLPVEVVKRSRDLLLDQLGCQLLGSSVEWNRPIYTFVKENKPGGPATIVSYGDKVPVDDAAFVNGTFGQGCELDDYYDQGGGHPGAGSIPVAMALGEKTHVDGKTFITAIVTGYEIGWRVGRGLLPQMMRRGFHSQGVIGVFIAAATAGKILQLNPNQLTNTFAIAGSNACGTMEFDQSGGEVKRMHNGLACSNGMRSAMVAGMGLTGPATIFEGERGILKVFGGECNPEPMTRGLGSEFAIMHGAIKRFPVNASQHSPIELLSKLVQENGIEPREVKNIQVGVNEHILMHGGSISEPKQVVDAQFSLRFTLALRLVKNSNDLRLYMNPKLWQDPEILEVGKKINFFSEPTFTGDLRFACKMRITLSDSRVIEGYLPYPKGTAKNPLSGEEIRKKFFNLGDGVLPKEKLNRIIDKVEGVNLENDISSLSHLMISAQSQNPN
jgi:2-methylcitrate dehydratase PrpD